MRSLFATRRVRSLRSVLGWARRRVPAWPNVAAYRPGWARVAGRHARLHRRDGAPQHRLAVALLAKRANAALAAGRESGSASAVACPAATCDCTRNESHLLSWPRRERPNTLALKHKRTRFRGTQCWDTCTLALPLKPAGSTSLPRHLREAVRACHGEATPSARQGAGDWPAQSPARAAKLAPGLRSASDQAAKPAERPPPKRGSPSPPPPGRGSPQVSGSRVKPSGQSHWLSPVSWFTK